MKGMIEGILHAYRPKEAGGYGFIHVHRKSASGSIEQIEIYFFSTADMVNKKKRPIVGVKAHFFVDPVQKTGKHPRAIHVAFDEYVFPERAGADATAASVRDALSAGIEGGAL